MQPLPATQPWLDEIPWIDRPEIDIEAYIAKRFKFISPELKEKLYFWRENGFVIFENVIDERLLDKFEDDIAFLKSNFHHFNIGIELQGKQTYTRAVDASVINDAGVKFNHLHAASRSGALLSLSKPLMDFLTVIFEAPPVAAQSLTFWRGSQQPIHIDYPYVCRQKRLSYLAASWIPLEDISATAGPLEYFPGGHQIAISGFFDWGNGSIIKTPESTSNSTQFASYLKDRVEAANIKPAVFLPKRGDALIWHGNLPHGGTRILDANATRKSYVTHYTSLLDYPDSWKLPKEVVAEKSVFSNGGYVFQFPWNKPEDALPSWTGK